MRPKIFFSHPVNTYNTPLEAFLLQKIAEHFPQYDVENPNQPHHQEGYERYKRERGNGMAYYYEEVLPDCGAGGVHLPFRDGKYGAGVFGEAVRLDRLACPVWSISPEGVITEAYVEQMRRYALTAEETRKRVYDPEKGMLPY